MSIRETLQKIKTIDKGILTDLYVVALIILVGVSAFGLGRLSTNEVSKEPIQIIGASVESVHNLSEGTMIDHSTFGNDSGMLVGSRNGSKYHYPWCSGAQRMKEENKIWFESIEDAKKSGYTPAANCKGLK